MLCQTFFQFSRSFAYILWFVFLWVFCGCECEFLHLYVVLELSLCFFLSACFILFFLFVGLFIFYLILFLTLMVFFVIVAVCFHIFLKIGFFCILLTVLELRQLLVSTPQFWDCRCTNKIMGLKMCTCKFHFTQPSENFILKI